MTFLLVNRVRETTISPGTGTATLAGAALGYQTFSAGVGANNTTYYVIADQSGANWEVGYGTVGAGGTTLARTTVLSSSNAGSLVNFASGTQDVWVDYPANKAVFQDSNGTVSVPVLLTTSTTSTTPNLSFNASNTGFSTGASISGSYLQSLLQNKSGTAGASTNYVLSNDLGTDSTYYGEFGMNSSVYSSGIPTDFYSINNGIYFSGHDGDITVGSGNGFKTYLAWGTTGQSAHVINAVGALGFSTNLGTTPALSGTTGYGTAGQVPISAGSTGAVVWSSTPTLTGTNFTGVPISTAISGLGTGVATALAVAVGSAGAFVVNGGALGTPSSGTLTNTTGFPAANLAGTALPAAIVTSSLASVGTIGTGVWQGTAIGAVYGGTGQTTVTAGDLLYGSAANTWSKLAKGTDGQILRLVTGLPAWGTDYTGTVTSVDALTLGTTGTDLSSTVANGTTTPVITLNVPTASAANRGALSSTDWSTFNGKQAALVSGTNIKTVAGVSLLGSGDVGTIGIAYGGTNSTATATAGGVGYGTGSAHAYTSAGTSGQFLQSSGSSAPIWATVSIPYSIDYLIVAGGGSGGGRNTGGGGGAGGYVSATAFMNSGTAYTVTVGAGGAGVGGSNGLVGNSGANSSFNGLTAIGGGGGGYGVPPDGGGSVLNGLSGGSGGGGGGVDTAPAGSGGSGTSGQGNAGGAGNTGANGGGGGGANAVGSNAGGSSGGNGGSGLNWQSLGTTYAGGGGGGGNSARGSGGSGGGGQGGVGNPGSGQTSGTANTGGGGGGNGGFYTSTTSGSGGSGIVIIRYLSSTQKGTGGTVTSAGGYYYHTFTSSGTYTG